MKIQLLQRDENLIQEVWVNNDDLQNTVECLQIQIEVVTKERDELKAKELKAKDIQ